MPRQDCCLVRCLAWTICLWHLSNIIAPVQSNIVNVFMLSGWINFLSCLFVCSSFFLFAQCWSLSSCKKSKKFIVAFQNAKKNYFLTHNPNPWIIFLETPYLGQMLHSVGFYHHAKIYSSFSEKMFKNQISRHLIICFWNPISGPDVAQHWSLQSCKKSEKFIQLFPRKSP